MKSDNCHASSGWIMELIKGLPFSYVYFSMFYSVGWVTLIREYLQLGYISFMTNK